VKVPNSTTRSGRNACVTAPRTSNSCSGMPQRWRRICLGVMDTAAVSAPGQSSSSDRTGSSQAGGLP
jgi:hypothetical protein